jgi:serine/threonine protein kinase
MTDQRTDSRCPVCGTGLAGEGGAWCPRCALTGVLSDRGGEPAPEPDNTDGDVLFTVPGHKVLAELGRGAAGIVYRARQERPAREVALKILRPHEAGSVESRARFRLEAVALAGLDHPVILPVLSVGEHDGLPYFTMKLCAGGSLAERLSRYQSNWRETAQLMATLAEAVHYAHLRGVLHRDLKPGNVLFDEADRPFVSDFGLAKLLEATDSDRPITRPMAVMGTPGYLAPEVLTGGANAATTAADVYALGAILHELLTGAPPPAAPSVAATRPGVPRDLAVIAAKCLLPEPGARYASAAALAEDLRAWLDGRPITARPAGRVEKAVRWCRRHPGRATSAGLAVLILLLFAVGGPIIALRFDRARRAAETERARAATESAISKAIADFLQNDLLAQAAPDRDPDRNLTLRTVLDRAEKKIDGRFADQPLVEAALRDTLAETYRSLGDYALAEHNLDRTIEIRRQQSGAEDPMTLDAMDRLAGALLSQGKVQQAEALARKTLEQQRRVLGPDHPDTLRSMETLGDVLIWADKMAEAEAVYAETLAIEKRVLGPEHTRTLAAMVGLAEALSNEQQYEKSEALQLQTLEIRRRVFGPEHRSTLDSMNHLVVLYLREGKYSEAEAVGVQTIEIQTRLLGPEHPDILTEKHDLAVSYLFEGKFAQAEGLERTVLPAKRRVLGPNHPITIHSMKTLGQILTVSGKFAEGEAVLLEALGICRQSFGQENSETLLIMTALGFLYQQEGKLTEAEALLRQTLEIHLRTHGPENPLTLATADVLGLVLVKAGKFPEAETFLRSLLERRRRLFPNEWRTSYVQSLLGEVLAGEQRFADAEPLLLAGFAGLKAQGSRIPASAGVNLLHTGECLVKLYTVWGKPVEAESWRRKIAEPGKSS